MNGQRWKKIQAIVDSGAGENVSNEADLGDIKVRPSVGSKMGLVYEAADGQQIKNRGETTITGMLEGGEERAMTFQVCDVSRPLLSVGRICEAGNKVTFEDDRAEIVHKASGRKTFAKKVNGVYVLEFWVLDSSESDFVRQGR